MKHTTVENAQKIADWKERGICDACIEYRLHLAETQCDSYNNFDKAHDADNCTC